MAEVSVRVTVSTNRLPGQLCLPLLQTHSSQYHHPRQDAGLGMQCGMWQCGYRIPSQGMGKKGPLYPYAAGF